VGRNGIKNMLIAQCPNCGTSFQVSIEQLQLASGRLQCGECETVFDAEDQLDPASDAVADPLTVEIDLDAEVERERLAALSARDEPSAGAKPARSDDGALSPLAGSENPKTGETSDQSILDRATSASDDSEMEMASSLAPSMDEKAENGRADESSINLEELAEDEVSLSTSVSEGVHQATESDERMSPSTINGTGPEASDTAEEDQTSDAPPPSADEPTSGSEQLNGTDGSSTGITRGHWMLLGLVVLAAAQLAYLLSH
jgi:predicted Zn finger-like uncharacterized protein